MRIKFEEYVLPFPHEDSVFRLQLGSQMSMLIEGKDADELFTQMAKLFPSFAQLKAEAHEDI